MTNLWTTVRQLPYSSWWDYRTLFAANPPATWKFQWVYAALILLCLVGAIAVSFLKIRWTLKNRLLSMLWTNGLIGIVLYFARVQQIPYIGTDGLRFLQEIGLIIWINSIVWYYRNRYKEELINEKARMRFHKYLPKAKVS